jgi:hypothetical protein
LYNRSELKTSMKDSKLIELVKELVDQQLSTKNVGYHVGKLDIPSESLKSRGWFFGNKVGYMGTGFYFFGKIEDARNLQRKIKGPIYEINLDSYNLYKPSNSTLFYEDIKQITQLLGTVDPKTIDTPGLDESLDEIADIFIKEHGISISQATLIGILKGFVKDVATKTEGTLLTNRLLEPLGYEGVDNRGNDKLDHYGVGSLLFEFKTGTDKQIS